MVSGQYNDPKLVSLVITLEPLEWSVTERKSSIVGGSLRKDSSTYNYDMLLHIHHEVIQMISSKESRLVRRSRAVSWEESHVVSCKWRCKFLALPSIIDSTDIRFIQYLGFFSTSFPKIIFFIFYAFVVYEPVERNFDIPCMSRTQTWKKIPFNWLHSFFTWLFFYHKEVTKSLFQHVKLCDNFLVNEIGNAQFYCKLQYANLVEWNSLRNQGIHLL